MSSHPKDSIADSKFTPVPSAIIKEIAPEATGTALKVLLVVLWKTWGEGKEAAFIDYKHMHEWTGVKSASAIGNALDQLTSKTRGIPAPLYVESGGGGKKNRYEINPAFVIYARNHKV